MKPVHAATQDDDQQAWLGSSGLRVPRHVGPGKEAGRHAEKATAVDDKTRFLAACVSGMLQFVRQGWQIDVVIVVGHGVT